jgi:hypothetical protein
MIHRPKEKKATKNLIVPFIEATYWRMVLIADINQTGKNIQYICYKLKA